MLTARPLALLAALLAAGTVTAAPITVTNGESFLLAYGTGGSSAAFNSTYGPLPGGTHPLTQNPGPFLLGGNSFSTSFGDDGGSASVTAGHIASGTGITISGSTAASSTGGNYVGQVASDFFEGIIDPAFTFGYYLEFTLDAATELLLTVDGLTGLSGDGAYADFGGILFDEFGNELYALGSVGGSGTFSEQFTLGAGTYFLFAQSQSSVNGQGAANAEFSVSLTAVEPVPEPLSLVAFGGLLAAGGLAVARRRRAVS